MKMKAKSVFKAILRCAKNEVGNNFSNPKRKLLLMES